MYLLQFFCTKNCLYMYHISEYFWYHIPTSNQRMWANDCAFLPFSSGFAFIKRCWHSHSFFIYLNRKKITIRIKECGLMQAPFSLPVLGRQRWYHTALLLVALQQLELHARGADAAREGPEGLDGRVHEFKGQVKGYPLGEVTDQVMEDTEQAKLQPNCQGVLAFVYLVMIW